MAIGGSPVASQVIKRKHRIIKRSGGICIYCGALATTVDHIWPICHGGKSHKFNLAAACYKCNMEKHAELLDPSKILELWQFNCERQELIGTERSDLYKVSPKRVRRWQKEKKRTKAGRLQFQVMRKRYGKLAQSFLY